MKDTGSGILALFTMTVVTLLAPDLQSLARTYGPGAYYSEQFTNWPPLPAPPAGLSVYSLGDGRYLYNDTSVDYSSLMPPAPGTGLFSSFTSSEYTPFGFTTNDFYIELTGFQTNYVTNVSFFSTNITTNIAVLLRLHGTVSNELYQLESSTNLSLPARFWTPGEIITGSASNNFTDFTPLGIYSSGPINPFFVPIQFFRAHHADVVLEVTQAANPAIRPLPPSTPATNGTFQVVAATSGVADTNFPFTYRMSGGAVNGIDYTNLPGTNLITISSGAYLPANIDLWPIVDNLNQLNMEAIMTLNLGTGYLVSTNFPSAIVEVDQNFGTFSPIQAVTTNAPSNIGMAWHPAISNLVLSINYTTGFNPSNNFARMDTNAVLTDWSGVSRLENEVNLAIVPTNAGGFTKGDMFFSNGGAGGIGWLSADGTKSNTSWASVYAINPDETLPEAGFYLDQTGIFSNSLVMATESGGIYTIDSSTNITPWAFLTNYDFEGVVTSPTETNQYGPWAGKILAGAEVAPIGAVFVTVDTNRVIFQYSFNVAAEDVHLIPTNQDFYFNENNNNLVLKLPRRASLADELCWRSQEGVSGGPSSLFILQWDSVIGSFIKHIIPSPSRTFPRGFLLEQGAFAPIDIPATSIPN